MPNPKQVYIVITVDSDVDKDTIADVIMVSTNKRYANALASKINNIEPLPGLNYQFLADFDKATVIQLPMNKRVNNVDPYEENNFHAWFSKAGRSTKLKLLYGKYVRKTEDPKAFGWWALSYYENNIQK